MKLFFDLKSLLRNEKENFANVGSSVTGCVIFVDVSSVMLSALKQ